jgi:hypothetical protein
MQISSIGAIGLLAVSGAFAQQPPDIGKTLNSVSAYAMQLAPMLEELRPKEWVSKGASDTYIAQWTSSLEQCKGLSAAAKALAEHPDRLPDVLQILFRIQSLEIAAASMEDGLRRYQNPALADLLIATRAESTPVREKLQQYAVELANEKDREFQVVDREAQRCRQDLSREAPRRTPK